MRTTIEFDPSFTMLTAELSAGESIKAEPGAMAAQQGLEMRTGMGGGGGLFGGFKRMLGGESFFLNTFTAGPGGGWISLAPPTPGDIISLSIQPGSELVVDTGHVVAFTDHVQYSVGKVGGLGSLIAGGEGLVLKFTGSGDVWLQTRTLSSLMDKLAPFLPSTKS